MTRYIEIVNNFEDGNCYHEITLHESFEDCTYDHSILQKCNSAEYTHLECVISDDLADVFELNDDNGKWLVFRFYECNVEAAFVFETEYEAKEKFDEESDNITPYDMEVKLTEVDDRGTYTCSTYIKTRGRYTIPDKFTRIIMVQLPELGQKIEV